MKNLKKNTKGITLVTLVITIVVLLILASIATYSGIEVIKSSKLTTFTTEMKIMQTQVNELYQRYKDGDNTVLDLGKDLGSVSEQANKAFNASGITEQSEYRYFDQNIIKVDLKIEGVEGEFFVNIKTRSVVSYEGFQYEGGTYYTLEQLPDGLYNVEYNDKNINVDKPTFDTSVEKVSEGKWRVTVSNIQYEGYIDKWQVNYKLNESNNWNTSEDLSFIVNQEGNYIIKIVNGNVKSEEKRLVAYDDSLPTEYQQVEYIESTGEQYFLLDAVSTVNFGFDIDLYVSSNTGFNVFGGYSKGEQTFCYMGTRNNKISYFCDYTSNFVDFTSTDYNVRHSYKFINNDNKLSYYYDNTLLGTKTFTNNVNCSIAVFSFMDNNGVVRKSKSEMFAGRIYKFIIYDNETVICNLIPCYRKSDNKVGMYDIISNKFYTNQGTGTFEKGADVNS